MPESVLIMAVHLDDVVLKRGAPNVDPLPTGTVLRDFMRGTDLIRLPEELVMLYEDQRPTSGVLIFQPDEVQTD